MKTWLLKLLVVLLLATSVSVGYAQQAASGPAAFYNGKTLTVTVAGNPGSGSDIFIRMMASDLASVTGSKPIVKNDDAGGGTVARNRIYTTKPDGLTIHADASGGMWPAWVLDSEGVEYDITKFEYLGMIKSVPTAFYVSAKGPYSSVKDLLNAKTTLRIAANSPGSLVTIAAIVAAEVLKLNAKVVLGYKGDAEKSLALQQGEADISSSPAPQALAMQKKGLVKVLFVVAQQRSEGAGFSDMPCLAEIVPLSDYHKSLFAIVTEDGKMLLAPPGTPADRVKFLQDGLATVLAKKEFQDKWAAAYPPWICALSSKDVMNMVQALAKAKPSLMKSYKPLVDKFVVK
jgi:tripartite-type tricarboxylate transporter receptor subunit TctC